MMKARVLGCLAASMLAGPMSANALVVTISGQGSADGQWDVSTFVGSSFADSLPTLEAQIWWGDRNRALAFASAVRDGLGMPNSPFQDTGPFFVHAGIDPTSGFFQACGYLGGFFGFSACGDTSDIFRTYAIASRMGPPPPDVVPEPGTLALLGLGLAGLGLSRRRKDTAGASVALDLTP